MHFQKLNTSWRELKLTSIKMKIQQHIQITNK